MEKLKTLSIPMLLAVTLTIGMLAGFWFAILIQSWFQFCFYIHP